MDKQNAVYPRSVYYQALTKGGVLTHSPARAESTMVTTGPVVHDSIHVRCLEKKHPQTQKQTSGFLGPGVGRNGERLLMDMGLSQGMMETF